MLHLKKKLAEFGIVHTDQSMAKLTTLHIGGTVAFILEVPTAEQLGQLLSFMHGEGVPFKLLGGGSNTLWADVPFAGVVIKPMNTDITVVGDTLVAGAGAPLAAVVTTGIKHSLEGLVWATGVPGTVGGAVRGNAGAMDSDTSRTLKNVTVWRDGEVVTLKPAECGFGYRESRFKHGSEIILSAVYQLTAGDKAYMMKQMLECLKQRNGKYPSLPSAGSFFKNVSFDEWPGNLNALPEHFAFARKIPAGWINERNDLKGFRIGGAMVSREHGNFIVNIDHATQADMLAVVEEVNRRAYTNFGVTLEPEVQIVRV